MIFFKVLLLKRCFCFLMLWTKKLKQKLHYFEIELLFNLSTSLKPIWQCGWLRVYQKSNYFFKINFLVFLYRFDILISKINCKK